MSLASRSGGYDSPTRPLLSDAPGDDGTSSSSSASTPHTAPKHNHWRTLREKLTGGDKDKARRPSHSDYQRLMADPSGEGSSSSGGSSNGNPRPKHSKWDRVGAAFGVPPAPPKSGQADPNARQHKPKPRYQVPQQQKKVNHIL